MAITTPVLKDIDAVFPGEGWFFYWKTSAALWESKIVEHGSGPNLLIPLNWAFHSDTGDTFDFGDNRPETDLKKLITLAKKLGKDPILFIPLTPVPFLPNGGIPFLLAKTPSLNDESIATVGIDSEGNINKMYSFFEPKVYRGHQQFIHALAEYLKRESVSCRVWGMDAGCIEQGIFNSYFIDRSSAFSKAFSRFLSVKKADEGIEILDYQDEQKYQEEFYQTIWQLYRDGVKEALPHLWEGTIQVAFLGGNSHELMHRFADAAVQSTYITELFSALAADVLPSSVLVSPRLKSSGALKSQLKDIVAGSVVENLFCSFCSDQGDVQLFRPLHFFEFYLREADRIPEEWKKYQFFQFALQQFRWNYRIIHRSEMEADWTPSDQLVSVFSGKSMDDKLFASMLKQFMRGGQILFDSAGLNIDLQKRLEIFLLENSLVIDHVHFITKVMHTSLGEGKLVIFDGDHLPDEAATLKKFWEKIFSLYRFRNLSIDPPEGIEYFWRTRSALMHELSYDEVRRLSLYNCSSYKKKLKFSLAQNFAFMKIVDQMNATVTSGQTEHEVELMPGASVSLDFGIFSL